MKAFFQTFLLGLSLFFATGGTSYGLTLPTSTDHAENPRSRHQLELGHLNDQGLAMLEFVLNAPEPVLQPQEEGANSPMPLANYKSTAANQYPHLVTESNYINNSALIIPGLSSLQLIFPFHLFP